MGKAAKLKLARRETRRILKAAFEENLELIKKSIKPKPRLMPQWLWRAIGSIYFEDKKIYE